MNQTIDTTQAFSVDVTTVGGATVLSPSGALTHKSCPELLFALEQAEESARLFVVLDCRRVKALDSEVLEHFVHWHERLLSKRLRLKLCNLDDVCTDILVATRLIHVLNVAKDIKQAVKGGEQ